MRPPLILAIDTSIGPCTVALTQGDSVLAYRRMDEFQQQSRQLISLIDSLFHEAGLRIDAVDAIACTLGPGSFTSLRVGLATAKGLALATKKPLIGLSTLEVMAHAAAASHPAHPILAVIDARRDELYAQRFSPQGDPLDDARVLSSAALAAYLQDSEYLVVGNARAVIEPVLKNHAIYDDLIAHPDAKWLAAKALQVHATGKATSANPIYIRPPDAKLPV